MPSSRGSFPTQELNPRPLHWQMDSLSLSPQGSPILTHLTSQLSHYWILSTQPSLETVQTLNTHLLVE